MDNTTLQVWVVCAKCKTELEVYRSTEKGDWLLEIVPCPKCAVAEHSAQPTLLACGHPATAIDPYDNSCFICRHEKRVAAE